MMTDHSYLVGVKVEHTRFGAGEVVRTEGKDVFILLGRTEHAYPIDALTNGACFKNEAKQIADRKRALAAEGLRRLVEQRAKAEELEIAERARKKEPMLAQIHELLARVIETHDGFRQNQ